ncbi:YdcF family protein [Parabacteroides sp.]
MKYLIMLLGSPNDETGKLSQIAMDRIECAYNLYANNKHMRFLCTGGFGKHFNTTNQPHASYAKSKLIERGVREEDFLPFTLSSNTYEDFLLSKDTIEKEVPNMLIVVTSDFHIERARLLHDRIINYPYIIFIPAKSTLPEEELLLLIKHEQNAQKILKEQAYK